MMRDATWVDQWSVLESYTYVTQNTKTFMKPDDLC